MWLKSPQLLCAALHREHFLITGKHTEILGFISCVIGQTVQTGEHKQTNNQTNKRMDRQTDATKCIISLALQSIMKSIFPTKEYDLIPRGDRAISGLSNDHFYL